MICPSCEKTLPATAQRCPDCGVRVMKMECGVLRTSAVFIASEEGNAVYASVRDVPEDLRRRLEASTTGSNSGTIVIADRRGKEEIEKAARFQRLPEKETGGRPPIRWNQIWPALIALTIGAVGAWVALVIRW